MAKIISKKSIEPVTVKCKCGTTALFEQRNEIWCSYFSEWQGFFIPSKNYFQFMVKCPTCRKTNTVKRKHLDKDIRKKKERNAYDNYLASIMN
jgi:hypothetical protein